MFCALYIFHFECISHEEILEGVWWPDGRASESESKGPGLDPHIGCHVVSLSKTQQLSTILRKWWLHTDITEDVFLIKTKERS